ncbi:cytochrome c peroxidase [Rhizobium sp. WL3]|uniref:cytochrome-c peroxidase n=1 Tax=Rhizobium sp. WL3 TaxID=2603277 RepID=UPI001FEFAAE3|nr:cytochrome c peroxidase [Rhizobium sp. WL3]
MQAWPNIKHLSRRTLGPAVLSVALAWPPAALSRDVALQASNAKSALSPLPPQGVLPAGKVALGARLFHDRQLSGREKLSCSACHDLETGGTVRLPRTIGYDGQIHAFNAPTIFNVGNNYRLGWRGRFTSLVVQNEAVLNDKGLMAANWPMLLARLTRDETYLAAFREIYGAPPSRDSVLDALVTFQMSLTTPNAPFDRYLKGDKSALTPVEKDGFQLFVEYGCVSCHQGVNIGGNMFQIFGVFGSPDAQGLPTPSDFDRQLQKTDDEGSVFRVPSLRNVEVTAPYFHDGSAATLSDAIAVMGRSQLGRELSQADIANLEAFLKSLTGEYNGKRLSAIVTETGR